MLYTGQIPKFDVSEVRPAGARLKTFGGRASGPQPLIELFEFVFKSSRVLLDVGCIQSNVTTSCVRLVRL
jgi:hypothetical protein